MPVLDAASLYNNRIHAIRGYHKACGIERAELDVSGGIDSAVMLGLLAGALGAKNVTAVYIGINSSRESWRRAHAVAKYFNVALIDFDATKIYERLVEEMISAATLSVDEDVRDRACTDLNLRIQNDPTILGSIRSTLRAPIGRAFNRLAGGGIRHGTGNEDEDRFLRFYQKGGDGEVDTNPLAMLSKGEVYQLAICMGVPREIVDCTPTPDLWGTGEKHNDEDELFNWTGVRFTYSRVDYDSGEYTHVGSIERVSRLLDVSEHSIFGEFGACAIDYLGGADLPMFRGSGLSSDAIRNLLHAARKAERQTRHKENPNIPTLGTRSELLRERLITNDLPEL